MWRTPLFIALALPFSMAVYGAAPEDAAPEDEALAFFERRIRPILVEHCYECHSSQAESLKGNFRVDTRGGLLRGGDSGPAILPGDSRQGTLLSALRHETFEMPPSKQLPASVVEDFVRWIEAGAVDPREGDVGPTSNTAVDVAAGRAFWAFQPLIRQAPPITKNQRWPRTNIDRFLLSRMEEAGMTPSADADRRSLLRRIYFDLIGLPTSPAQIKAFLADDSPTALESVVDQLLASPHFGERWGRHWLDVARFAESTGGGRTRILQNAWRYRDYVLSAWNRDKPYDEFVREQLAGDLLPWSTREQRADQLSATGYLALGPINYELQDKTLLRMEIVDEQLDSIGKTFLGMTIGCARCHDHKFDPIPTTDYYALAGIFRSTKTVEHANVSNYIERPLPVSAEWQDELDAHAAAVQQLEARLAEIETERSKWSQEPSDFRNFEKLSGIVVDDRSAERIGQWKASTSVRPFVGSSYQYAAGDADGKHVARFVAQLDAAQDAEQNAAQHLVRLAYTPHGNRASNTLVSIEHLGGTTEIRVNQRKPPPDHPVFLSLGKFKFQAGQPAVVTVSSRGADGNVIIDAVQFLPAKLADKEAENRGALQQLARLQEQKRQVETELASLQRSAPAQPPQVLSVLEEEEITDCPLHVRGSVRQLGETVPRGFLRVASWSAPTLSAEESGRRELVEWLVDPQHPLTARVLANRIWHHLMGVGLVRTVDNFGAAGERPSHPDLLDYLAHTLIDEAWSTKSLIRQIVLSRGYGLSSRARDTAGTIDPENRLLSHQHRRRLDAEAIRDSLLAVSGDLDRRMYGPTLTADIKSEFDYEYQSQRRSVYVPVFRNTLHDLFEVFDFANPNLVSGRRTTSTLPTQALYLMNSPFIQQRATAAARRHLASEDATVDAAFESALGRPPSGLERQHVDDYLAEFDSSETAQHEAWTVRLSDAVL